MNVVIYNEINGGGSVALVGSQLNTLDGKAIIDQNAKQISSIHCESINNRTITFSLVCYIHIANHYSLARKESE